MAWLATAGPVVDASGMASTALASAVEYPGSSIAFAQLLSGMERAGLIRREIRGKRTYRIELTDEGQARAGQARRDPDPVPETSEAPPAHRPVARTARREQVSRVAAPFVGSPDGVDYDELARRLLAQVAEILGRHESPSDTARSAGEGRTWLNRRLVGLERQVGELQRELARVRAAREALEEENETLRQQLERTQQNLEAVEARLRAPRRPTPDARAAELDDGELALLQRMLDRPRGRRAATRVTRIS
ncbi:hypothetical protein Acit_10375 [Aciditerrimonas ferrireducens]|nr:hypothetical protein [Aciditerrimonas ferrireducens]